jgi:DNA polymerase III delta prime subunit
MAWEDLDSEIGEMFGEYAFRTGDVDIALEKWASDSRAKRRERTKVWRAANRIRARETARAWRMNNIDHVRRYHREKKRAWRAANAETARELGRKQKQTWRANRRSSQVEFQWPGNN